MTWHQEGQMGPLLLLLLLKAAVVHHAEHWLALLPLLLPLP
jgi:hypothetical protein